MPIEPSSGRSLVSRRAIIDIVHAATLGSYGVTGFSANPLERALETVGIGHPGVRLDLRHGLALDLELTIAYGLPVAEVARQVESAVRYAVRRALHREVDRLTIHVDGLAVQPGSVPPRPHAHDGIRAADLAESGTDVA